MSQQDRILVDIDVEWHGKSPSGTVEVVNGSLESLRIVAGAGESGETSFRAAGGDERFRIRLAVRANPARIGRGATVVTIDEAGGPFSFRTVDVSEEFPIFLKEFQAVVLPGGSASTFAAVERELERRAGRTEIRRVEDAEETTWESAAARSQDFRCETLLGLARDQRIFTVTVDVETIHATRSLRFRPIRYNIPVGRGNGPRKDVKRRLDQGVLPILRATKRDGDITYELTFFATLAGKELTEENVRGTHYLVAERGLGMEHTPKQAAEREAAERAMRENPPDDLMLCYRLRALNTASAPRYAFFYVPTIVNTEAEWRQRRPEIGPNGELAVAGSLYGVATVGGQPWPKPEVAVLLKPGESIEAEYRLLHAPVPQEGDRVSGLVANLKRVPFERHLSEARAYWSKKLEAGARLDIPEQRIHEMAKAGLLHLDMITYGEQEGPLAATIGWYSPIGTESSPIIQFYDSMGWHDVAERCLDYFLAKQHDDGFMQNFGGYMLETGAALWTLGEHYRYTRDDEWVRRIAPKVKKSCEWIINRRRADSKDPQDPAAGLIVGKVADPEDPYRQFMLNGYHYLGLRRAAEMLANVDPPASLRYAQEAEAYRGDIRRALKWAMARSPVVPLGDGRWVPSCPPWAEGRGFCGLGVTDESAYTHGSIFARDSLIGPLYAVFTEVFDPGEPEAQFLVEGHYELMCQEGIAFSQPYYSRHPEIHLLRGEVKTFIKAFYSGIAGLADRETYTFWEHHFGASPHKTHEEGWFLMQLRRMLYMEEGDTLKLLPGVPRDYLAGGKRIALIGAKSYFGAVDFVLESRLDDDLAEFRVRVPEGKQRGLRRVAVRVPLPDGRRAVSVSGGRYDPESETVTIADFDTEAAVTLRFGGPGAG